jgi:hypothetical protein
MACWGQPGYEAEVVTGPDAVDRVVEGAVAADDVQAGSVDAAADEDVVDPPA